MVGVLVLHFSRPETDGSEEEKREFTIDWLRNKDPLRPDGPNEAHLTRLGFTGKEAAFAIKMKKAEELRKASTDSDEPLEMVLGRVLTRSQQDNFGDFMSLRESLCGLREGLDNCSQLDGQLVSLKANVDSGQLSEDSLGALAVQKESLTV